LEEIDLLLDRCSAIPLGRGRLLFQRDLEV
jgi:hypothetical protein